MLKRNLRLVLIVIVMLSLASFAPSLSAHAGGGCNLPVRTTAELIRAIEIANIDPCDTVINMSSGVYLFPKTYGVSDRALPQIEDVATSGTLTINGNSAAIVRDKNAMDFGIFKVKPGANVTLNTMFIQDGRHTYGGGIDNAGTLTLNTVVLMHNSTYYWGRSELYAKGAAIYNTGKLTINNSAIRINSSTGSGGGIHNEGLLTLNSTPVEYNKTEIHGGGIYNTRSTARVI
jgi:hypothetical protein